MRPPLNIVIIASLGLTGLTCEKGTDPPPPYVRSIELSAEDASCTEAWLRVRITDGSQPPFDVRLTRDDQTLQTLRLSTPDSVLIDEGLLPNRTYAYRGYLLTDSRHTDSTTLQTVTTMDTTSSNWVFDPPVLLGDGSSSVLYDVAIINDTLAYAVGEIYKRDSLGNWDPQPYNLAKWNGAEWSIHKVPYYHQVQPFYSPIRAVFAFNENDIWFGIGNLIHWNGQVYNSVQLPPGVWGPYRINKIWGHDGEIWIVGDGGSIAHRSTSGTWRRLESGTTVTLNDVWGGSNRWVGENVVLVAASNKYTPGEKRLLRINSSGVLDTMPWPMQDRRIHSTWFAGASRLYTSGGGVFQYKGYGVWDEQAVPLIYTNRIRGTGLNSLFVAGDFSFVAYFNGVVWRTFPGVSLGSGIYHSIALRENVVVAVGSSGGRAVLLIGRRQT